MLLALLLVGLTKERLAKGSGHLKTRRLTEPVCRKGTGEPLLARGFSRAEEKEKVEINSI